MLGKHLNHCEDSLTAAVFSHLLHMPEELFWQILRNACYAEDLPAHAGEPQDLSPFPKWGSAGTRNNTYVEPDFFIRFRDFDLIIEAKRWDEGMQDPGQWERELIAYANEYGEERRTVKLIAVGGIHSTFTEEVRHTWRSSEPEAGNHQQHLFICPVLMCRWRSLLSECQRMARELTNTRYQSAQARAHQRVLADLVDLFAVHGFQTGKWLDDLVPELPRLSAQTVSNRSIFQQVSSLYSQL